MDAVAQGDQAGEKRGGKNCLGGSKVGEKEIYFSFQ
jgi:hypothetical protein